MDMPDNAEYDYDTKLLLIDGAPMPWPITNVRLDTAPNKTSTVTVEIPVHSINAQVFGPRVMHQGLQPDSSGGSYALNESHDERLTKAKELAEKLTAFHTQLMEDGWPYF